VAESETVRLAGEQAASAARLRTGFLPNGLLFHRSVATLLSCLTCNATNRQTTQNILILGLRFLACALAAILFLTGLLMLVVEPGWESAQYLAGGIYILLEASLMGVFARRRTH
jgi:hypothetical protein